MKRMHTLGLCMILLINARTHAQESPFPLTRTSAEKPKLFSSLPDQFECSDAAIQQVLSGEPNEQISIQLSSQFHIIGQVVDKSQQSPGVFSVNVRLSNYHNALFNLAVRLQADNSVNIQGRIIHPRYGDVLILTKERDKYFFKKQLQKLYMPE